MTFIFDHRFEYFQPVFEEIDHDLIPEKKLYIIVEVDVIADEANNFSRNWVKLEAFIGFPTLNQKFIEKAKETMGEFRCNLDIFLDYFQKNDGSDSKFIIPVMFEVLYHNLEQFGGQMGRKDTFFLQFFQHGQQSNVIIGLHVLHSEYLNHIASESMSNK